MVQELPGYFYTEPDGRRVHDPNDSGGKQPLDVAPESNRSQGGIKRLLAVFLILGLASTGALLIARATSSPSPDERATEIARLIAKDVLLVVSGDPEAAKISAAIQAVIADQLEGTGCEWADGTVTSGVTREAAVASAGRIIAAAKAQLGDRVKEYGIGHVVIPTGSRMKGIEYIAVIAGIHCPPAAPMQGGPFGSSGS